MKTVTLLLSLALSPLAHAEDYVYFSGLCVENNQIVNILGSACTQESTAYYDLLAKVNARGKICQDSLTRVKSFRFATANKPTRADGCEPDLP